MINLKNKKILLTGGRGFLGSYVFNKLIKRGVANENITVTSSKADDLRKQEVCARVVNGKDIIIHCAGKIGGIAYTLDHPAEVFYDNAIMALNIIEESRKASIEKFTFIGTACSYPRQISQPFREEDLWAGYPDEINATYGLSKRMALVQAQSYRKEYNFNSIYLILSNLYGPGDDFTLKYSHVIPALVRKAVSALEKKQKEIVVWGTGNISREFIFVEDAAEAIVLATERYDKSDPVNIGSGEEIYIKDLVKLIIELVGFDGKIKWDTSKPDGQPRRSLDVSRARTEFFFEAKTSLIEGIKKTIKWYIQNKEKIE